MLTPLEYAFLGACREVIVRQQELVPLLARTLGVPPTEVFYRWVIPPRCTQSGVFDNAPWRYFFHGVECDVYHLSDGRMLRLDFGPGGRYDTFTGWGVLQFVMTTRLPWRTFPDLQRYLAQQPPPYDELSGDHSKMTDLFSRLEERGLITVADPDLYTLVQRHTTVQPDGSQVVVLPEQFQDPTSRGWWDTLVCQQCTISDVGLRLLAGGQSQI
jgi:hypothetical protein